MPDKTTFKIQTKLQQKEPEKDISHLSVNLLPQEIILQRKQSLKLTFSTKFSVGILVTTIFLTSAVLTVRLIQNNDLKKANEEVVLAQNKVDGLKTREEQVILLKTRLASIQGLIGGDSKRKAIFNLVVFLSPADIKISDVTVDKSSKMTLSVSSSSLTSIGELIASLSDQEKNANLISKVDLDGLSVGKDGVYRFGLKITTKQ